jgi:hypothetical protein
MAGWILFALVVLWYFASMRYVSNRSINLESYVVFLLLDDDVRANHKLKFQNWIAASKVDRADTLRARAGSLVQSVANDFAEGGSSLLGSSSLIWSLYKRNNIESE